MLTGFAGLLQAEDVLTAQGVVYHDVNGNGLFDAGDEPLEGVAVSNGRETVLTDARGRYQLPVRGETAIFVIEPRGYHAPLDDLNKAQFYYVHSPEGATGRRYRGLEPTGPLPDAINFALLERDEPDQFDVLVFADTQPRTIEQIYYSNHRTLVDVIGMDVAFGVTLGDIVSDRLDLFEPLDEAIALIGVPWRHVIGNHDIDPRSDNDSQAKGAYRRLYGPTYYAFTYGPAHFIVLDNIYYAAEERRYKMNLGRDQLTFLRNEIARTDEDQLIVLMAHIDYTTNREWADEQDRRDFFELLASRENIVSMVGHRHMHRHEYLNAETMVDYPEGEPHHLMIIGSVCGHSHWGMPNEYGIPHAMMRDGTPVGYGILSVDGNDYRLAFRASGRSPEFQMHIHTPDAVAGDEAEGTPVIARVFNALPDAEVAMRIVPRRGNRLSEEATQWIPMTVRYGPEPFYEQMHLREQQITGVEFRPAPEPPDNLDQWQATLPAGLPPGMHLIEVRSRDRWHTFTGRRVIHITE